MPDNIQNNVSYGLKISQLASASNVVGSNYTVLVQNGQNGLTTRKATVNQLLEAAGKMNSSIETRVGTLETKTTSLSSDVRNLRDTLATLTNTSGSEIANLVSNVDSLQNIVSGNSEIGTVGLSGKLDDTTSKVNLISANLSDIIEDPSIITTISSGFYTISSDYLKKSDIGTLSDDLYSVSSDFYSFSSNFEEISSEFGKQSDIEQLSNTTLNFSKLIRFISFKKSDIINNEKNKISCNYSNSFIWIDKYCFENTNLTGSNLTSADDNDSLVSSDGSPAPGTNSFDIRGIPIRAGMFINGNLKMETLDAVYASIYLTNAAFYTDRDSVLSVMLNGNTIAKRKMLSSIEGIDSDLNLVWSGFLDDSTIIDFSIGEGSNISSHNLIGAIVPS